jgi:hypothetical protein
MIIVVAATNPITIDAIGDWVSSAKPPNSGAKYVPMI